MMSKVFLKSLVAASLLLSLGHSTAFSADEELKGGPPPAAKRVPAKQPPPSYDLSEDEMMAMTSEQLEAHFRKIEMITKIRAAQAAAKDAGRRREIALRTEESTAATAINQAEIDRKKAQLALKADVIALEDKRRQADLNVSYADKERYTALMAAQTDVLMKVQLHGVAMQRNDIVLREELRRDAVAHREVERGFGGMIKDGLVGRDIHLAPAHDNGLAVRKHEEVLANKFAGLHTMSPARLLPPADAVVVDAVAEAGPRIAEVE